MNDHADPGTTMCQIRAADQTASFAPTIEDAKKGLVSRFEFERLERMSGPDFMSLTPEDRRAWVVKKLGRYERQLYESARTQRVPVQLLAVVIINELLDINTVDLLQEEVEFALSGSFGIAQIQVDTALNDGLIQPDEQFAFARAWGMERPFVKGRLQTGQYAIDAAAREIRMLLDRMQEKPDSAWVKGSGMTFGRGTDRDLYLAFSVGSQDDKEAKLAEVVAAAYNSPDIIVAQNPERYSNGTIHGRNAGYVARMLFKWKLFRPECP